MATESSREMESLRTSLKETIEQLKNELCSQFKTEEVENRDISRLEQELRDSLQTLRSKLLALPKETAVLRRLSFKAMFRREDAIVGPEYGTFEWILGGIDLVEPRYGGWSSDRGSPANDAGYFHADPRIVTRKNSGPAGAPGKRVTPYHHGEAAPRHHRGRGSRWSGSEISVSSRRSLARGRGHEVASGGEDVSDSGRDSEDDRAANASDQSDSRTRSDEAGSEDGKDGGDDNSDEEEGSKGEAGGRSEGGYESRGENARGPSVDEDSTRRSLERSKPSGHRSYRVGSRPGGHVYVVPDSSRSRSSSRDSWSSASTRPDSGSSSGRSLEHEEQQDRHRDATASRRALQDFARRAKVRAGAAAAASGVRLHGVYYRGGPSISKIYGNEPYVQHGAAGGWVPHLQHIMSVSEHARRRQIAEAFALFLRQEQGVYFCCGKAGSGKSTFMKHISHHRAIARQLRIWSGAKKLVLVNIFFWNSGDEMQMSMEGFYRSLLFQVIQQCPESLPEIFPSQAEGEGFLQDIRGNLLPFRFSELQEAIRRLLKTTRFPTHRFCFFIDGLDEFKGDSAEHFRFAQLLKDWATDDVKIVCSARPYTEFLDTFTDPLRTIHLHEWTRDDIHRYASWELFRGFVSGGGAVPKEPHARLAYSVARKADGVFIWARLVVRSLVEGIRHGDSVRSLYDRADQAPRDLNHLYERILDNIDPAIRARSEDALLLVAHCPFLGFNALAFTWLEDLEDEDFPMNRPFRTYSLQEIQDRRGVAWRQVTLLTRGLVEIRPVESAWYSSWTWTLSPFFEHKLDFHHLTVKDFLTARAAAGGSAAEDPEVLRNRYARLVLAEIKFSGELRPLLNKFRVLYIKDLNTRTKEFHPVPDRYLDELAACFPAGPDPPGRQREDTTTSTTSHLGVYDQGSQGRSQIWLEGPRVLGEANGWRPRTAAYHLVWKGPVPNLVICYALSLRQPGYVLRRLQRGDVRALPGEELAAWLFVAWTMYPDPAVTEYILSERGLPEQRVEFRDYNLRRTLGLTCWLGFLSVLSHAVQWPGGIWKKRPSEDQERPSEISPKRYNLSKVEMLCQTLEHLLKDGVDRDVVFLLMDADVVDDDPDPDAELRDRWEDWALEEGSVSYMELATMLELIQPPPPNLEPLRHLLGTSPAGRLRAAAGNAFSRFAEHLGVKATENHLSARKMYKPATDGELRGGRLRICGIASKDEVVRGPLTIFVY